MRALSAIAAGAVLHLRVSALTPMAVISSSLTPVGMGILLCAGATDRGVDGQRVISIAFIAVWGTMLVQSVIAVVQERNWGTMRMLATTPSGIAIPLLGRVLAAAVHGLVSAVAVLLVLLALVSTTGGDLLTPRLLALLFVLVGYAGVTLVIVSWIVRHRYASGGVNGLFELVLLFSGAVVAVASLPAGLRPVGYVFPSVRIVHATPAALAGQVLVSSAWLAVGLLLLTGASNSVRRTGKGFLQ